MPVKFSSVTSLAPVPAGTYDAKLSAWERKEGPKDDYYALEFTLEGGGVDGRKAYRNQSLSESSLWATKKTLIALGADSDDLDSDPEKEELDDIVEGLIGNPCKLAIKIKPYQGEDKNEVTRVMAPDSVSAMM